MVSLSMSTSSCEIYCSISMNFVFSFTCVKYLQSIYVTRDLVILKFEASVQIYVAVLNFGCKIQNSDGNVVSVSKINSCELSF